MTTRDERGRFIKGEGFWTGKKRPNISGKKNNRWVGKKNDRICGTCGTKFRRAISNKIIPKYCSQKCFGKSQVGRIAKEKNPNWKDGKTEQNHLIRHSPEYNEWRKAVYKRDYWTCQICLKKGNRYQIVAHHIKTFDKYPELRFEVSNGITLCRKCHLNLHREHKVDDFTKILNDYMPNIPKG